MGRGRTALRADRRRLFAVGGHGVAQGNPVSVIVHPHRVGQGVSAVLVGPQLPNVPGQGRSGELHNADLRVGRDERGVVEHLGQVVGNLHVVDGARPGHLYRDGVGDRRSGRDRGARHRIGGFVDRVAGRQPGQLVLDGHLGTQHACVCPVARRNGERDALPVNGCGVGADLFHGEIDRFPGVARLDRRQGPLGDGAGAGRGNVGRCGEGGTVHQGSAAGDGGVTVGGQARVAVGVLLLAGDPRGVATDLLADRDVGKLPFHRVGHRDLGGLTDRDRHRVGHHRCTPDEGWVARNRLLGRRILGDPAGRGGQDAGDGRTALAVDHPGALDWGIGAVGAGVAAGEPQTRGHRLALVAGDVLDDPQGTVGSIDGVGDGDVGRGVLSGGYPSTRRAIGWGIPPGVGGVHQQVLPWGRLGRCAGGARRDQDAASIIADRPVGGEQLHSAPRRRHVHHSGVHGLVGEGARPGDLHLRAGSQAAGLAGQPLGHRHRAVDALGAVGGAQGLRATFGDGDGRVDHRVRPRPGLVEQARLVRRVLGDLAGRADRQRTQTGGEHRIAAGVAGVAPRASPGLGIRSSAVVAAGIGAGEGRTGQYDPIRGSRREGLRHLQSPRHPSDRVVHHDRPVSGDRDLPVGVHPGPRWSAPTIGRVAQQALGRRGLGQGARPPGRNIVEQQLGRSPRCQGGGVGERRGAAHRAQGVDSERGASADIAGGRTADGLGDGQVMGAAGDPVDDLDGAGSGGRDTNGRDLRVEPTVGGVAGRRAVEPAGLGSGAVGVDEDALGRNPGQRRGAGAGDRPGTVHGRVWSMGAGPRAGVDPVGVDDTGRRLEGFGQLKVSVPSLDRVVDLEGVAAVGIGQGLRRVGGGRGSPGVGAVGKAVPSWDGGLSQLTGTAQRDPVEGSRLADPDVLGTVTDLVARQAADQREGEGGGGVGEAGGRA